MSTWVCTIDGCADAFEGAEDLIVHQTTAHEQAECKVCGTVVPDGYFAIRHAFDEHSRAEYVRAYGASATDVRTRERVKDDIESATDLDTVVARLDEPSVESLRD